MSASAQQVVSARSAIASVTTGTAANQDAFMTQWCSTNWGDLLQPAPLSISLLGSILLISSSTSDFSLDSKAPPGCPPFEWKYARHPDSFKACLMQMVGDGYLAFMTAHKNMEVISANSGEIPNVVKTAVAAISKGSSQAVSKALRTGIEDLKRLSQRCCDEAKESEAAFCNMTGLAQEMVLACTYTAGTTEQALAQNKTLSKVLQVQKESEETMLQDAKDQLKLMKDSYDKAEQEFKKAVEDFPSGWDLLGMAVVEAFTDAVSSIGNALSSGASLKSQGATAGVNAYSASNGTKDKPADPAPPPVAPTTAPNGVDTQPNADALSDPATALVPLILAQVTGVKMLLTGKAGKPDWDQIRSKDGSKNGGAYIQTTLNVKKKQLDPSKSVSRALAALIDTALDIIGKIIDSAGSVGSMNDNALADQVPRTDELSKALEALSASVNLILQQPGSTTKGLTNPTAPTDTPSGAGPKAAMDTAMMKVEQTKAQLESTRDSYKNSAKRLVAQQQEITATITELTQVSLAGATLEKMLPVLIKAVGSFTVLRAQFFQLSQFFDSVASLLVDIMGPSVERWATTLEAAEKQVQRGEREKHLAGVTISAFTRDLIYRQMTIPLKVSMLAKKISDIYLEISTDYIIPAQKNVSGMLQFAASPLEADKKALIQRLTTAQDNLAKCSALASSQIATRVLDEQRKFEADINTRLNTIMKAIQGVLPEVTGPVPKHLKEITDAHIADTDATKAQQAQTNPMFNPDDSM
ncbi:hypothetical protein MVEN_01996400 [Mycena venus]|uniref:Uncharacterized protein n=1 Tax=Mycena venus TaxID=2733690 RepID=A0A8H7CK60_9AGAR|nr:hypothetical protein MVEN_01996400 [Mycena venus]